MYYDLDLAIMSHYGDWFLCRMVTLTTPTVRALRVSWKPITKQYSLFNCTDPQTSLPVSTMWPSMYLPLSPSLPPLSLSPKFWIFNVELVLSVLTLSLCFQWFSLIFCFPHLLNVKVLNIWFLSNEMYVFMDESYRAHQGLHI